MSMKKSDSFYIQGSILALSGLITKVIGLIYKVIVANLIGSEGNGIYVIAFRIYNIILTLSSYSLPLAISKMISARYEKKEYNNMKLILSSALMFALGMGTIAATILYMGSSLFEIAFDTPGLSQPLKILAPTVFIVSFLGVFRGFFQGCGNMIPTALSQLFEQIANAVVSIVAAAQFVALYSNSPEQSAYGAYGSTLGTLSGAATALIFLLILFFSNHSSFNNKCQKQTAPLEKRSNIIHALIMTAVPVMISQTIYQIGGFLDSYMFANFQKMHGISSNITTSLQGVFDTQYSSFINIPIAFATAMASSTLPAIVRSKTKGNISEVKSKTKGIIKFNMLIAFPSSVGLAVLAKPITRTLFPEYTNYETYAVNLLVFGSCAVIFYALSTITTSILQANNYMKIPVVHAGISLVIHIFLVSVLLAFTSLSVYALMIGTVTLPLCVCLLNCHSITKYINFKFKINELFTKPALASLVMGIATWSSYKIIEYFTHKTIIGMIVSILASCVVYLWTVGVLKYFTYEELIELPFGNILAKLTYPNISG